MHRDRLFQKALLEFAHQSGTDIGSGPWTSKAEIEVLLNNPSEHHASSTYRYDV